MKLAIVLSTQPAAFDALAYKGAVEANIRHIHSLGYDGVELAVRDPRSLDRELLKRLLRETGLDVPAIGTGQAYGEEGLSFTHPDASVRQKAVERIRLQMDLAAELGAVVIIGLMRGKTPTGHDRQWALDQVAACLAECLEHSPDVRIAIEPINRYETNLLCTVDETLAFIEQAGLARTGLLLDTFHMNIEEPSIFQSIEKAAGKIFHFHVADSNRWYPGAGHIDFSAVLDRLHRAGYQGTVSAEILPLPDPDTASRKTIEHLGRMLP
ncbi:sugar phosphate isomerase/epimerase [candidate division KSB1 bacterium]|nr:sugar phosphate isomerase/epimerase [candidate division KSB1 bacterium]